MDRFKFIEGRDFYLEKGKIIMTEEYLIKRGVCCAIDGGCRHCPYEQGDTKCVTKLKNKKNL
jgi:hypothetical protein